MRGHVRVFAMISASLAVLQHPYYSATCFQLTPPPTVYPCNRQASGIAARHFSIPDGSSSIQEEQQQCAAREVSASILEAMRKRTHTHAAPGSLHVATDLYDDSTGLHSEGVWHNALVGIACLKLSQDDAARRIANSLWEYSWDGVSFQRRAYSGNWNHTNLDIPNAIEQPNYYRESSEHRCVQHGMALILWSELVSSNNIHDESSIREQQRIVARAFIDEYWNDDENKWTTVGASQGGGTVLRPSASAAKQTLGATQDEPYYRAVDHAIGILACLAHFKVLKQTSRDKKEELGFIVGIIQQTCDTLLSDFGYGTEEPIRTYIGLDRNLNFWHDGWSMLALTMAHEYAWPDDSQQGKRNLEELFAKLIERYGHLDSNREFDGTVWHWPRGSKSDNDNVRYCGDNVLLYAISRNLSSPIKWNVRRFWDFVDLLRSREDDGLASVATCTNKFVCIQIQSLPLCSFGHHR